MHAINRTASHGLIIICLLLFLSACSFTRYTDGPLTHYLTQPLPKLSKPIAQTFSLEKISYQTAQNMKAVMISDLVNREIYLLPEHIGKEVKGILKLDEKYNKKATYRALNLIAKNRAKARHLRSTKSMPSAPPSIASSSDYIRRQESMAKNAYKKGDYLKGNIHSSAASNAIKIDQSFARAQSAVNVSFSLLNAMAIAGEALIKRDFMRLHRWIEQESGAINKNAPRGSHLSVFFLQFFDAESFQLDSRNRVAVYLVLTQKNGKTKTILEGSDILVCEGKCDLFTPKSTAKTFVKTHHSQDIKDQLWTPKGTKYLTQNGFDPVSGFYQFVLLKHALKKLNR